MSCGRRQKVSHENQGKREIGLRKGVGKGMREGVGGWQLISRIEGVKEVQKGVKKLKQTFGI